MLVPQLPFPPHQGTSLRNFNLIAGLSRRHEIHLFGFIPPDHDQTAVDRMCDFCAVVEMAPQPTRTLSQRLLTTFTSPLPDMAHRLTSPDMHARLRAHLQRHSFEVIDLEGIEMAPYLPTLLDSIPANRPRPRLVFDNHNAEYVLQKRVFQADAGRPARWPAALYSLIQWLKLAGYEAQICRRVDVVSAVSAEDAAALHRLAAGLNVVVIPNGVDISYYTSFAPTQPGLPPRSLVFTGTMDFRPNVDAAVWFVEQVFPLIRRQIPDAVFYIVGQRPHRRVEALAQQPGVRVTGRVPDARPYIADAEVYVIPLRSGGGTRLKVLEAMAMHKAIVSTPMGCDGYPITDGQEVILADRPALFAQRVVDLLGNAEHRRVLGQAAFDFALGYDWSAIAPRLEAVWQGRG